MSHNITRKVSTFVGAKKRALLIAALGMVQYVAFAQAGTGGIAQATDIIKNYNAPVRSLLYAIAAIIALIGAFNVFAKMQNGDQDVKKTILMTVGGCIALIAMAQALPAFFGGS